MTRKEKTSLKTVMWRLLQFRKVVTYDDLQELAGVSRSYAQEWMATLIKREVVRKLSKGRYQLIDDTSSENPARKPLIQTLGGGQKGKHTTKERPEHRLWVAIRELKSFKLKELQGMNLANITTTSQYVSLLNRAGLLKSRRLKEINNKQYEGCYPKLFTVTDKAGSMAPLMGRSFYIFDPNSGEYWATPMEKFETKKRPGDGRTS